jgi:hypothetical protein
MRANSRPLFSIALLATALLVHSNNSQAVEPEKELSGWSFYFDNDFFTAGDRDNDYTGGIAFKLAGTGVKSSFLSVDSWLESFDRLSGFTRSFDDKTSFKTHAMEYGITLFTPVDISASNPVFDQHPYASLLFVSNTQMVVVPEEFLSYQSTLTVGFLGLPVAGELQKTMHELFDADRPNGWDNQISAGGELTFRYSISRSRNYIFSHEGPRIFELKTSTEANIGFATDVGVSFSLRWGTIQTPWWTFNPHNAEYISLGSPVATISQGNITESYLWLGMSLKYRFYNAFLEGQFRDSVVTYDRDDLDPFIKEIWLGYTHEFEQHWQLSVFIRARNNEIDLPTVNDPMWGGFIISQSF